MKDRRKTDHGRIEDLEARVRRTVGNISTTVITSGTSGSGTVDQLAYWSGASSITGSSDITRDSTALLLGTNYRLYAGTTSSIFSGANDYFAVLYGQNEALRCSLKNTSAGTAAHSTWTCMSDTGNDVAFGIMNSGFTGDAFLTASDGFIGISDQSGSYSGTRHFYVYNRFGGQIKFATNNSVKASLTSGGTLCMNATAANGSELLRVNGTTYLDSSLTIAANGASITGTTNLNGKVTIGSTTRTISGGAQDLYIANGTQCQLFFDVNNQAADNKLWDINPSGTTMQFRCINDANSAANSYMSVTRSGSSPTAVIFNEDSVDCDLRIESNGDTHNFFSDGGADTVCIGASSASDSAKFYVAGKISTSGEMEINGDLNHDGTMVGLYAAAPVVQDTGWSVSNVTTDRTYDADATTIDEIADVLGTLIDKLKLTGIIGA